MYAYLCISRPKDNQHVAGFKKRTRIYLFDESKEERVLQKFRQFVSEGVPGERARLYRSVNERDVEHAGRLLMAELIMKQGTNEYVPMLLSLNAKLCSAAMQTQCAVQHRWLFDVDTTDEALFAEFMRVLGECYDGPYTVSDTINGRHVIVEHGFDTRPLNQFDFVELKRDGMTLIAEECLSPIGV